MEAHYHAWLRTGRTFLMQTRPYAVASTAHRYAEKLRPDKADRLVLACTECPPSRRSRRQQVRWNQVAARLAEKFGADRVTVRAVLRDAIDAERNRK